MTIQVDEKTTVRDLVGHYSVTRPIFEKYGIDYCCGGGICLADAASEHGVELSTLIDALKNAFLTTGKSNVADKDWYAAPLDELVTHIVDVHHGYMKTALSRLRLLVPKVLKAHGARHGDMLEQVQRIFNELDADISAHLAKEEQMLFPYIVALATSIRDHSPKPQPPFGSARNPIRQMEHEHENAGALLTQLRQITNQYTLLPDACPTFAAMYEELQHMEADLHQHIHLENNILFPRTIDLEE